MIRSIVRDPHATEDILQDTYIRGARRYSRIDRRRPGGPWLTTIARRLAINHVRDRKSHAVLDVAEDVPDSSTPHDDFEAGAVRGALGRSVSRINPRHQRLIEHREFGGLSYDQIAAAEGVSVASVKGAVLRARENLKVQFLKEWGEKVGAFVGTGWIARTRARLNRLGVSPAWADAIAVAATVLVVGTSASPDSGTNGLSHQGLERSASSVLAMESESSSDAAAVHAGRVMPGSVEGTQGARSAGAKGEQTGTKLKYDRDSGDIESRTVIQPEGGPKISNNPRTSMYCNYSEWRRTVCDTIEPAMDLLGIDED